MITRRTFIRATAGLVMAGSALGGYALAEPFRQIVTRYKVSPPGWPKGLSLKLAVLADLHAVEPWMGEARIEGIVAETNALGADAVLLLGDFVAGYRISRYGRPVPDIVWASALARLRAPLGVHAVLGNHDWWVDRELQRSRRGRPAAARAVEAAGIPLYENHAVRMRKDGRSFWIAGLGDQWAYWPRPEDYETFRLRGKLDYIGVDDLDGTLRLVNDDAPVILMAHEPDIFDVVPDRVSLTIAGHTHGGQVRFAGFAPIVPSRFGRRFTYGHIIEGDRHLVVSGGLGLSGLPVRFGAPPEIVVIEIGA